MSKESDNETTIILLQRRLNEYLPASMKRLDDDGWGAKLTREALDAVLPSKGSAGVKPPDAFATDERTLKNLATLWPDAAAAFRPFILEVQRLAKSEGLEYVAISGTRTAAEQNALYAQGRTKPGKIVTNAKAGQSNHNFGVALDFGVFQNGRYLDEGNPKVAAAFHKRAGALASKFSLKWGGDWVSFPDLPHFEAKTPKKLK